jgi:subtilisin-like proprotein convertase family protein
MFVTFKEPLPDEEIDEFAGRYALIRKAAYSDRDFLFQLTDHTWMNPVKLVVTLTEQEPLVESAEHDLNQRVSTCQLALPTDPAYARQWPTPALGIPDNDPAGVRSTIQFGDEAAISSVKVTVDITHTFIGDLRLTLTGPHGTPVVLHNKNGGSANDIRRAFDSAQTRALSALVGQSLKGDWTLHVQDFAAVDEGRLNRWELEIEGQPDALVELEEAPGTTIPDNKETGIERTLTAPSAGRVKEVEAAVEITHTYVGDLLVELVSPTGTIIRLHEGTGGTADNLIKTYIRATTPRLQDLHGQTIQGAWRLKVSDRVAREVGKLNRWALKFTREPEDEIPISNANLDTAAERQFRS